MARLRSSMGTKIDSVSPQMMLQFGPPRFAMEKNIIKNGVYRQALSELESRRMRYASLIEMQLLHNREIIDWKKAAKRMWKLAKRAGVQISEISIPSSQLPKMRIRQVPAMLQAVAEIQKGGNASEKACGRLSSLAGKIIAEGKRQGWLLKNPQFYTISETAAVISRVASIERMFAACDFEGAERLYQEMKHDKSRSSQIVLHDSKIRDALESKLPAIRLLEEISN
ncbi:MAG: hypothetical protein QW568_03650 [Candidatus Anstonellaceae archaeon]